MSAIGDIWRVGSTVTTTNFGPGGKEDKFRWVVVYHYRDETGGQTDANASLELVSEQQSRDLSMVGLFGGNTFLTEVETLNVTSSFSGGQGLSTFIGDGMSRCLPPQVAVAVSGSGLTIGRRAIKYWGSISEVLLDANGLLKFGAETTAALGNTYRTVLGIFGTTYVPVVFGATETPQHVVITESKLSPTWRTQRRRVLDFTQGK